MPSWQSSDKHKHPGPPRVRKAAVSIQFSDGAAAAIVSFLMLVIGLERQGNTSWSFPAQIFCTSLTWENNSSSFSD